MASETLIEISRDEIEAARLTSELKYILDNQSMRVSAKREGKAEGLAEGHEKGLVEGLEKGLVKGRQEGMHEVAQNLKAAGISADIIFQTTGIKTEE